MTDEQITSLMQNIHPRYQERAAARAVQNQKKNRRRIILETVSGSVAIACAAVGIVLLMPKSMTDFTAGTAQSSKADTVEVTPVEVTSAMCSPIPFGDFSDQPVLIISNNFISDNIEAPMAVMVTDPDQKFVLYHLLTSAVWTKTERIPTTAEGENEPEQVFVKHGDKPFELQIYEDGLVEYQQGEAYQRYQLSDSADLQDAKETIWTTLNEAACSSQSDPEDHEDSTVWCDPSSVNAEDIWKNCQPDAPECDLTTKDGIIYKMSNSVDYFHRASGFVRIGNAAPDGNPVPYCMTITRFETNLNTGYAYENIVRRDSDDLSRLLTEFDGLLEEDTFIGERSSDLEHIYDFEQESQENERTPVNISDAFHRINSRPLENGAYLNTATEGFAAVRYRTKITNCQFAAEALEPQERIAGFLGNYDNWEIAGETTVNSRACIHLTGHLTGGYSEKVNVSTFDFYVDKETGILLKYLGYDSEGALSEFVMTNQLSIK